MSNIWQIVLTFLAGQLGYVVLVVAGIAILLWVFSKFLSKSPNTVKAVVDTLRNMRLLAAVVLGDKWIPVYDAVIEAGENIASDGALTQDEAKAIAQKGIKAALENKGITLSTSEQKFVDAVIDIIVRTVVENRVAAASVFSSPGVKALIYED